MKLGKDLTFLMEWNGMGPQDALMGPQEALMCPAECGGSNGTLKKFCLSLEGLIELWEGCTIGQNAR